MTNRIELHYVNVNHLVSIERCIACELNLRCDSEPSPIPGGPCIPVAPVLPCPPLEPDGPDAPVNPCGPVIPVAPL